MKLSCLRQALLAATFAFVVGLLMSGCGIGVGGTSALPVDTLLRSDGSVTFLSAAGEPLVSIAVEISEDSAAIKRGLMYRRHLPENMGMLFVYAQEHQLSFWMKNTYLSLDMIFINSAGEIVGIVENTQPLSEQLYPSQVPARYVVEVKAGFCATQGIKIGGAVLFARDPG